MKKNILLVFLLSSVFAYSQNDCSDALIACGNSGYQDLNATGVGTQELSGSNTCGSQENNSLWFRININTGGKLGFILTPTFADGSTNTDLTIDFDFFVFGPNVDCANIGQAIRCSTTNPRAAGTTSNLTGMNSTETETSEGPGALGNNFVRELDVIADDSYFIVIDRPIGTSNFKIEWTGTATFNNPPSATPPTAGESYDLLLCDSDGIKDNSTNFDLTSNENSILNGQTNTSISYHTSNNGALTNSSPIPNPSNYKNISSPENIFIRLTDTNTLCFTTTEFVINAYTTPEIALQPENLIIDDLNNDGSEIVDLTAQDASIFGTQDISEFEIVYATDITFNTIITDPVNHTSAVSLETIYFRIVNQNNVTCFSQGSFTVTLLLNQPPELTANNRVAYCPLNQVNIAPNFTISDPDDTGIDAFFIQISSGYDTGTDQLTLTGTHPNINTSWNTNEGKLTLTPIGSAQILHTDLELAVRNIIFESTNANISSDRFFSFTIGDANYLPSTEHFYVFESDIDITWTDAKTKAEGKKYYGLQGYLATILSAEESQISAEQISGAGWIGANDTNQEGVWNWVTGPEGVINFWNGTFTGSAPIDATTGLPMYSNWNTNEPNQSGDEDYAHITDNSVGLKGSWNDLPNEGGGGDYQAKGYIIEYGGMPGDPILQISASTSIYVPKIVTISADTEVCAGTSVNLTAAVTEGTIFWYDALLGGSLVSTGDTFTTPVLNNSKTYYATASPIGCATSDRKAVVITVYDLPIANDPQDIIVCDDNGDGLNSFDFDTDISLQILNGQSTTDFEILYFNNQIDAEANITDTNLPNPHNINAGSSENIFARIHNKNYNTCFDIVDFNITVTDLPIAVQPEPYRICDDLESSSDTDGIINTFLLNTRDTEVLGTLDTNQYSISYHTSQNGAEINDVSTVIPKDSNHSVTNSQTLFIRVENKDNLACYDADKTLDLFVNPLPVLKTNPELEQCISADDNTPTVNLTTAEVNISETANVTFDYFEDLTAATQIIDPTSYPVIVNTSQAVFVRVTSEFGCARDLIELTINVGQTPDNPYNETQTPVCDDFLDADGNDSAANNDTDFITNFSLDENAITTSINPPVNTIVYFYENADDRNNTLNEIDITNYRNDINRIDITTINSGIQFPIYYKILSTVNNNCQGLGEFYLQINATPAASSDTLSPILECDTGAIDGNYTNGSNRNIDLTQRIDELFLGTNQDQNDYDVTFYKSVTNAFSGDISSSDYIDTPTQFTNDVPSGFSVGDIVTQSIFVRVQNKATGCANPHTSFEVIINPIPIITNLIPVLEVCDIGTNDGDVRNGLAQNIDVSVRDIDIIGTRIAADFKITYHKTRADAEDLSSTGIDKNSYDSDPTRVTINPTTNISEESLLIRIIENSSGCAFDQSTLTIIVNPEPNFETISNLSECDNNDDGDDANQIIQTIDLDGKITEILGASQDPDDYIVTFHATKTSATSGEDAISSPYANTAQIETIFVRIQNKATLCINDEATFDIIVNSLPNFMVTSPQIICLNDTPKNISIENPEAIYNYVWKNASGNEISAEDNLNITTGGSYTVKATTTDGTNCSRTKTIVITESNPAVLLTNFITIVDQGNNIGSEDNLSIVIDVINNDLGPGDYQFALRNDDQNTTTSYQDEPLFENLEGAIYTIIVNDKNGCVPDATLQVSVLQFPKFFTPNGDGKNDTYKVKGANKTFYPNSSINIFNRYGKLVAQIPIDSQGWNGTYNGKKLSSDDYWYNITLIPADNNKQIINKTGNFSLLRK